MTTLAYSYLRFSHPRQSTGDSIRRQTEYVDGWVKRNGVTLDTNLTFEDRGVSGMKPAEDRAALSRFLHHVQVGDVPRGSYLIVESLDRLSRQHIRPALTLLLNLIESGIRVVQLLPVEMVYDENVEPMALLIAIMELSRGHSESAHKGNRVGAAWGRKKAAAAQNGTPHSKACPSWLRLRGDHYEEIPEAVALVQQIFTLAVNGWGARAIAKKFNQDGVKNIAKGRLWNAAYVASVLKGRHVLGEYQPCTIRGQARRSADGAVVAGYYPAIITEDQWHAARAALVSRRRKGGRPPVQGVNLFAGLLVDARTQSPLHIKTRGQGEGFARLVSRESEQGGRHFVGFPVEPFEKAILTCLSEIQPADLLGGDADTGEKVLALSSRLEQVTTQADKLLLEMETADNLADLNKVLKALRARQATLAEQLATARAAAANPVSAAWGACKTLVQCLAEADDPQAARLKLRGVLQRIITSILVVTTGHRWTKRAAVQICFTGGRKRDYLLTYTTSAQRGPANGVLTCDCLEASSGLTGLDFTNPDHLIDLDALLAV